MTGPNPVDRGAANTNDCLALRPLVMAIPAIRSRRGPHRRRPAKLRADKGYDSGQDRAWLRQRVCAPHRETHGPLSPPRASIEWWKAA